jgi:hypothetical protein
MYRTPCQLLALAFVAGQLLAILFLLATCKPD